LIINIDEVSDEYKLVLEGYA
jgi:hypothetical protein